MSGLTTQLLALGVALLLLAVWIGAYRYLSANLKSGKHKPHNDRPRPAARPKEAKQHE